MDSDYSRMLRSLARNIEAGNIQVREVETEFNGSLFALTLIISGEPKLMVDDLAEMIKTATANAE